MNKDNEKFLNALNNISLNLELISSCLEILLIFSFPNNEKQIKETILNLNDNANKLKL